MSLGRKPPATQQFVAVGTGIGRSGNPRHGLAEKVPDKVAGVIAVLCVGILVCVAVLVWPGITGN